MFSRLFLPLVYFLLPFVSLASPGLAAAALPAQAPSAHGLAPPSSVASALAPAAVPAPAASDDSMRPAGLVRGNTQILSFGAAKTLLRALYREHPYTLYSNCHFDALGHEVDYGACAWQPRHPSRRSLRIEWEHSVPAEAFGSPFRAWREGSALCVSEHGPYRGRRCASKTSRSYRRIEADLYNLVPEIGEVNQLRSNKPMAELTASDCSSLGAIGGCVARKQFMPRPEVKGDVARTYLYMHQSYPELNLLSDERSALFVAWAEQDPVDAWECRRAARIEALQHNENWLVKGPCLQAGLWPTQAAADAAGAVLPKAP